MRKTGKFSGWSVLCKIAIGIAIISHPALVMAKQAEGAMQLVADDATAQTVFVKGVVVDETGEPLAGASVKLKGASVGVVTDIDGKFVLSYSTSHKNPQLEVSFVGMENQVVSIADKRDVRIELRANANALDEMVVIGYGTSKVRDITGATAHLGEAAIKTAPMTSDITSMLQGKAAGVNVMISNSSPTSPVSVVIRGQSSLSGDGQPLWVIDGVPQYSAGISGDVSNTLYNLNLNDVQSIDILKDASATAIYGSRAANGVVLVTTKSGAEGMKPEISFSARMGWQSQDVDKMRSMNAEQYIAFSKAINIEEAFRNGGMTYFSRRYMDEAKYKTLQTSQWDRSDISDMWLPTAYYDGHDNYWDMMTQAALAQDYNIALRGGSQKTSYYASLNYKDQDGIVKGSNSKFIAARFNFETRVIDQLKFGLNMDVSSRTANNKDNLIGKIIDMRPDYPAYNEDGTINTIDLYTKNPLVELLDKNYSRSRNINASAFLEYDIFSFLKFRTTINTTYQNVDSDSFSRRYYDGNINSASKRNSQSSVIVWDNLLTFYKTMGIHDVTALAGYSMEKESSDFLSAAGKDFPDDDILTNLGSAATRSSIGSNEYESALVSAFARVQYRLMDRYLLTGTFRADGSSRFGRNNRWGYFPSIAGGWIITEEPFMKSLSPVVNYIKLRASYGRTGSQNLGYYDYSSYMGSNAYNSSPGIYPSSLGNDLLQWESQEQWDLGLDFGLWNDRIRGAFGWYRKYVDNLITSRPVPYSSAFDSTSQNVGAISNTGIEFDVTIDLIRTRDLNWQFQFNAAHNKGRLEKLNGVTRYLGGGAYDTFKLEEGGELGAFYGYVDAGRLYLNAEEAWANQVVGSNGAISNYRTTSWGLTAGDVYLVDLDGDGKITPEGDRKILGSANPDVFGGFGTSLFWKGLMCSLNFTYSLGGKRYCQRIASRFGGLNVYNAPEYMLDSWVMKGADAEYPTATHYGMGSNNVFCDRWLSDASYMRLSALNVSYRLPESMFRKFAVKAIELTFQATNLFTITKYPGFDPQGNFSTSSSALYGFGTDYSYYPPARTYNVGIKLTIN